MLLSDFDYALPESAIANAPVSPRDHARLMKVDRRTGERRHRHFFEIGEFLRPGDLLVINNTKVLPARLFGHDDNGRRMEVFLLKRQGTSPLHWQCLVRPGKRVTGEGVGVRFSDGTRAILKRSGERQFEVFFPSECEADFTDWLHRVGNLPLPPYIKRPAGEADGLSYQTVYAKDSGSVAAPTAGLHFTQALLDSLRQKGIRIAEVTLDIGYGTFSPIRVEELAEHRMHEEQYRIPEAVHQQLLETKKNGGRVIAVGTTSLRALESIPYSGLRGNTQLFIQPGFEFQFADGLITNFHLPKSSLFILVAAFLGLERTQECYREAVEKKFRFFSYGDAMAII